MKFLNIKVFVLLVFSCHLCLRTAAQDRSDVLENALGAVVTVGVFETDVAKKTLGFRGNPSEMAYAKMLDLTGVRGSGSGFFIRHDGKAYVVTNSHVIENAADADGSIYIYTITRDKYKAKIVGGDSFYDIAVLELVDTPGAEVSYLKFRPQPARIAEQVYAIGNPLGEYPYSVSEGIISAKNRVRGGLTGKFGFLQSTATVIWGNSGGPLVDVNGAVLGINSQIAFASNGGTQIWQPQINFALEGGLAERLVNDILTNDGLVSRAYLGIEISQKSLPYAPGSSEYNLHASKNPEDKFPVITGVAEGAPATSLSAYLGHQILSINGEATRNLEEALGELEKSRPGQRIDFILSKNGIKKEVSLTASSLNEGRSLSIGNMFLKRAGATYTVGQDHVNLAFQNEKSQASAKKSLSGLGDASAPPVTAGTAQWQILGIGLMEEGNESLWRVNNAADIGTAARLTGMLGVVDIVMFRSGSDPENANNYVKKRIILSDNENMIQSILWY